MIANLLLVAAAVPSVQATADVPLLDPFTPIPLGDDADNEWTRPFFEGATYDPSVTDPEAILGQPVGSRLASHDEILAVFRALAATSDRVVLRPYGRTYEGRELLTATITSPRNHARMDAIEDVAAKLWDPRTIDGDLDGLLADQPGIAWMGYGIHGDETSASEAAVPFAYHLAACTDDEVAQILDRVVVVLDPCLNPDGRERIRSMVLQSAGFRANLDDGAMQRGRWPGGRGNHYLFDMNRDWMAGEAPETRGRWARLRELPPQLFVDAHEMSGYDTFLFYPQTSPRNTNLPERLEHWQVTMAADAARVFDGFGWGYYTREWADALYPGYSDAWGSLTGAIGLLYEQGRTIGAPLERESGEVVAYRETVHGQVAVSMANLSTFAANREEIQRDYVEHRRRACATTLPGGDRAFVVRPSANAERDARFLRTLLEQGIEVKRATESFTMAEATNLLGDDVTGVECAAGTWFVSAAQPQGSLVRTYLEFDPRLEAKFLVEERESIERGWGSKVYDVTAWNLARQAGVDGYWTERPTVASEYAGAVSGSVGPVGDVTGAYAWVCDAPDARALRFAARVMELGGRVHLSDKAFDASVRDANGETVVRSFARGSLLLRRHENPDDVDAIVVRAARDSRAVVYAVESGRGIGDGPDLGGGHFSLLERPKVALLSNSPVGRTDVGHVWRYLDEELRLPVTLVDAQSYRSVDLDRYNVLILPAGAGSVAAERSESLATWVRAGGTLITIGSTAFAIANEDVGLSENRRRRDVLEDLEAYRMRTMRERASLNVEVDVERVYGSVNSEDAALPDDSTEGESSTEEPDALDAWRRRFAPAGVILRAEVDPEAWLTSGVESAQQPVPFAGSSVLMSRVRPAVRLAKESQLRLGGLVWPEARVRIADSAWATVESLGRGQVISFAASPVFRGSWRGTERFLGNAVVLGPGFTD